MIASIALDDALILRHYANAGWNFDRVDGTWKVHGGTCLSLDLGHVTENHGVGGSIPPLGTTL